MQKKSFGQLSEYKAAQFLLKKNFQILARNFQTNRGEVDLIARDQDSIVFVEVKARRSDKFGTAIESVTEAKLQKIVAAGQAWLQKNNCPEADFRVDVVTFDQDKVEHLQGV